MKSKIKRGVFYLVIGFAALFGFRLVYGYVVVPAALPDSQGSFATYFSGNLDVAQNNYASQKFKGSIAGKEYSVDQKYEKIGSLLSRTDGFDEDEKKARDSISRHNALIQFEQNSGLKGQRRLSLAIGVPPDNFDGLIGEMREIGRLASSHVDKTDKTNEYKDLNAKRVSLEKIRDSLVSLKGKTGNIDEYINLENRILEIEQEIQSTGVKLGEYDQENEFCTVKFGLEEGRAVVNTGVPFIQRVKVALEWSIKYYLVFLAILIAAAVLSLLTILMAERLPWVRAAIANYNQAPSES